MEEGREDKGVGDLGAMEEGRGDKGVGDLGAMEEGRENKGVLDVSAMEEGREDKGVLDVSAMEEGRQDKGVGDLGAEDDLGNAGEQPPRERRCNRIPEDHEVVFVRSTSLPRGRESEGDACNVGSWRDSFENDISRPLMNVFKNGDDVEDEDALRQSPVDDDDDESEALLESTKKRPYHNYGSVDVEGAALPERIGMRRAQTAPAMTSLSRERTATEVERPQFASGSKIVKQAMIWLAIYLAAGVAFYAWKSKEFSGTQTLRFVDAVYFCVVTMCTIGYGDIVPVTPSAKLFSCALVLVKACFIDAFLQGMVAYVLDQHEQLLLSAVEGSHFRTANNNRMRIRMKVALALGVPVVFILIGTLVMVRFEDLSVLDAFYCTFMSVTTVGYGDHTFKTSSGRLFASVWLLLSTLAVARCLLYLTEAGLNKRERLIAKWMLNRQLTVGDLVQADLDHDGCISTAEVVLRKAKEMRRIKSWDISDICHQFDQLDLTNSGKINLARLQDEN